MFVFLPKSSLVNFFPGSLILSPNVNKEWSFTCSRCPYVPYRDSDPDTIAHDRQIDADSHPWIAGTPWMPVRCTSCDTKKKRHQRMRKRTRRVWRLAEEIVMPTYHYPKLITFSLLTDEYYSPDYHFRYDLLNSYPVSCHVQDVFSCVTVYLAALSCLSVIPAFNRWTRANRCLHGVTIPMFTWLLLRHSFIIQNSGRFVKFLCHWALAVLTTKLHVHFRQHLDMLPNIYPNKV